MVLATISRSPIARLSAATAGRLGLIAALLVVLAGCGFHLRGRSPLPKGIHSMQVTYYNAYKVGDPVLVQTARERLRARGLLGGSDAQATLAIQSVRDSRAVTSVTPRNGNVATYSVTTSVTFSYSVNGATQIANKTLSTSSEYTLNETQRLASNTERNQLYDSMQKQLVDDIFLRIAQYNQRLVRQKNGSSETKTSGSQDKNPGND